MKKAMQNTVCTGLTYCLYSPTISLNQAHQLLNHDMPENLQLSPGNIISDPYKFVEKHIAVLQHQPKNSAQYKPHADRLRAFYNIITNL